jgi:hypothetical protein
MADGDFDFYAELASGTRKKMRDLTPEEKKERKAQWRALSPEERRARVEAIRRTVRGGVVISAPVPGIGDEGGTIQMSEKSAAGRAAETQRQQLARIANSNRGKTFSQLGVTIKNRKVYKGTGLTNTELGDLDGACAGLNPGGGVIAGVTTFVRLANGQEKRTFLRSNKGAAEREVAAFNAMADAVSGLPTSSTPATATPAERMAVLARLRDDSLITDDEYQTKRAEIISEI